MKDERYVMHATIANPDGTKEQIEIRRLRNLLPLRAVRTNGVIYVSQPCADHIRLILMFVKEVNKPEATKHFSKVIDHMWKVIQVEWLDIDFDETQTHNVEWHLSNWSATNENK